MNNEKSQDIAGKFLLIQQQQELTQKKFADVLGVHVKSVQNYLAGRTTPDAQVLARFCRKFKISANWLLLDSGDMELTEVEPWPGDMREYEYVVQGYLALRPKRQKILRGFLAVMRRIQRYDGLNTWVQKVIDSDKYHDLWAVREKFDRKEWKIIKAFTDYRGAYTILRYRQKGGSAGEKGEAQARAQAQALNRKYKEALEEFVKDWKSFLES